MPAVRTGSYPEPMRRREPTWLPEPAPLPVRMTPILRWGCLAWAIALVVTLLVPGWHDGERDWWPTLCATGLLLGLLGLIVVRRW